MKKLLFFVLPLFTSFLLPGQAPKKFSYQAVIRNSANELITNQTVGMQISIRSGSASGNIEYRETHSITTNSNGLVSLVIGEGSIIQGDLSTIDWNAGPFFLQSETDPTGGTNYSIAGTSQLLSVPFALHANTVDSISETDPVFQNSVAAQINDSDTAFWNSKLDEELDSSVVNELQVISLSNDTIYLSQNGGSIKLPVAPADGEINDLITFDGTNWIAKSALIQNAGGSQPQNNMQPWLGVNYIIALQGIFPSRSGIEPFIAEISMFGGNFAPRGWAFCDGQLLAISQNSALFSLLGTIYGGDGRTTFALPDLRGRVPLHPGNGPGLTQRRLGEKGGSETNVMNNNQMPAHNHTITFE